MKGEVYKEKVNTRDELVAHIMNSAALIKEGRQDDLRKSTRTFAKRFEKCIEIRGENFWTITLKFYNLLRSFS